MDIWREIDGKGNNPRQKFSLSICLCNKLSAGRRVRPSDPFLSRATALQEDGVSQGKRCQLASLLHYHHACELLEQSSPSLICKKLARNAVCSSHFNFAELQQVTPISHPASLTTSQVKVTACCGCAEWISPPVLPSAAKERWNRWFL